MSKHYSRGHRYAGASFARDEERHWITAALIASAVVAAASTALTTYAAVERSDQEAKLNKSVQRQKDIEAEIARQNAEFEANQSRRRSALLLGKQRAILAATGVDPGTGSPLLSEIDLVKQAELEALAIQRGGQIQAQGLDFEGKIAKYRKEVARGAIPLQIAGGVLSTTATGFSTYAKGQGKKTMTTELSRI